MALYVHELTQVYIDVADFLSFRKSVLRFVTWLFICCFLLANEGCTSSREPSRTHDEQLVDDYGDTVVIAPYKRIVSLNPTTTEILFAIGAGGRLVGRSVWDNWPDSAKYIPALGNAIRPNIESVLAARPDLIILYASEDNRSAAERFRAAGIKTLSLKTDRIRDFDRATRLIGRVTGDTIRANIVADSVKATLDRVRLATKDLERPTVVWPFAYRPPMVVGGGSFLNELLDIAGATNLYGNLELPSPTVTIEDIVNKNPRYVLRSAAIEEMGPVNKSWYAIPAVREGRLLVTPTDIVARPSVQLGQAAVVIARTLHPGLEIK